MMSRVSFTYIILLLSLFVLTSSGTVERSNNDSIILNKSIPLEAQLILPNKKYVVKDKYDLKGDTLIIPSSSELIFKRGQINNGHISFDKTTITAKDRVLFKGVTAGGTINNQTIIVKWFDCTVKSTPEENFRSLKYAVLPVAILSGADVYHSEKGTYKIWGQYPIYESSWKKDHSYIRDFRGITIFGTGYKTVIKATKYDDTKNPSDVFNMVDLKNLHIRDFGITSEYTENDNAPHGTNGVSLVESIENVSISTCRIFNLPSVYNSTEVTVDGGHGITIQAADPNTVQRNIHIFNNIIDNVSLGLDFSKGKLGEKGVVENVVFEGNIVTNSYVGFYSHGTHEEVNKGSLVTNNTFKNCQFGIFGYAMQGFTFTENRIITTKRVIRDTKISDGVYGILLYGPKDVVLTDNFIKMKNADSFMEVDVVSKNPKYNGLIENTSSSNNSFNGSAKNPFKILEEPSLVKNLNIKDKLTSN